jgi:ubiquinone/menaquinone biosynthesis C-methylase UbiE
MYKFANPDQNISKLGLASDSSVAIFGSGAGGHTFATARALGGKGSVYAIDSRGEKLERMKHDADMHNLKNIKPTSGNIEMENGTRLGPSSVDAVVIPNTLFSHDNKEGILKEASRILKQNGTLLIIDWKESFGGIGPQPDRIFSEVDAIKLAENTGFKNISSFSAGAYHYGLVFSK